MSTVKRKLEIEGRKLILKKYFKIIHTIIQIIIINKYLFNTKVKIIFYEIEYVFL